MDYEERRQIALKYVNRAFKQLKLAKNSSAYVLTSMLIEMVLDLKLISYDEYYAFNDQLRSCEH